MGDKNNKCSRIRVGRYLDFGDWQLLLQSVWLQLTVDRHHAAPAAPIDQGQESDRFVDSYLFTVYCSFSQTPRLQLRFISTDGVARISTYWRIQFPTYQIVPESGANQFVSYLYKECCQCTLSLTLSIFFSHLRLQHLISLSVKCILCVWIKCTCSL